MSPWSLQGNLLVQELHMKHTHTHSVILPWISASFIRFSSLPIEGWEPPWQASACCCDGVLLSCCSGTRGYNVLAHAWKSLRYKCMQHVHLASVLLSVPSCGPSWILHPASSHYQPASACLIWNGCSFEACDWLLGRLFCLWAVFPSIRGFLFFQSPPAPHSQLLFACTWMHSAHAGSTLALLCIGLFQADFFFLFFLIISYIQLQKKSTWTLLDCMGLFYKLVTTS